MSFDANVLLASLAIGGVGCVCFAYGKKQGRVPQMLAGIALVAFPYFVSSLWLMSAIAAGVLGALWLALKLGW